MFTLNDIHVLEDLDVMNIWDGTYGVEMGG